METGWRFNTEQFWLSESINLTSRSKKLLIDFSENLWRSTKSLAFPVLWLWAKMAGFWAPTGGVKSLKKDPKHFKCGFKAPTREANPSFRDFPYTKHFWCSAAQNWKNKKWKLLSFGSSSRDNFPNEWLPSKLCHCCLQLPYWNELRHEKLTLII